MRKTILTLLLAVVSGSAAVEWVAPTLRGHRAPSLHRQRLPSGTFSVGFSWACPLLSDVTRRTPFGADPGVGLMGHPLSLRDLSWAEGSDVTRELRAHNSNLVVSLFK